MKTLSKRLIIDTATKYLYVAIFEGERKLDEYYAEGHNDHSVKLMSEIERMFGLARWKISDLDAIIVGIGPGSYTGLRIGVVIAKMFAWNDGIPLYTVSSLALIASAHDGEDLILAEMDARRGNSFLGLYRNQGRGMVLVEPERHTNLKDYQKAITEPFSTISFGRPNIVKLLHSDLLVAVEDVHKLSPNYLRPTQAERNLG